MTRAKRKQYPKHIAEMTSPRKHTRKQTQERNAKEGVVVRVLRVRLKDKHAAWLLDQARSVNLVWNYCNEMSVKVLEREQRFVGSYELDALTAGATKEGLDLHSQTLQALSAEYVTRRNQFRKAKLSWRVSNRQSSRYSLGWVPFKKSAITYRNGQVHFRGKALSLWDSYGLGGYDLGPGSFSEDSRGRWFLNVTVKVKKKPKPQSSAELSGQALGIDLGLKSLLADSEGNTVEAQRFYRDLEQKIATAQRAGKKDRVRALHAKVVHRRKDFLHKTSTNIVSTRKAVFVGDVNSSALAKTSMAKSVLDAGWSAFRTMLQYKCDDAGVWFKEVDEKFSTQACSECGAICGPKGREGLSVRRWTCSCCGTEHDRDTNAAKNIRNRGLAWLEKEFSSTAEAKADETVLNKTALSAVAVGRGRLEEGIPVL